MELTKTKFKQTEIGLIPEDWEASKIDSKIDLLTGFPFPSSKYSSSGIKLLRGSNIKRGKTDWSEDITQYWDKIIPEIKKYVLKEYDIVIAMDGSLVGRSFAQLKAKDLPALLLQRVARVRSDKIDINYLKEYICSTYFTKHCDKVKTSSAIPHISPKDIKDFYIPIPPTIDEQKAIAQVLRDTDNLIQTIKEKLLKKKAIKQGAMQKLLAPKEDWEVKTLLELADSKKQLFDDGDWIESEHITTQGVRLIQTGNIGVGKYVEKENKKFIYESSFEKLNCKELFEGDLLICRLAEPAGRTCVLPKLPYDKIVTSVDVTIFRPRPEVANRVFLMNVFSTSEWFNQIYENVGGTTHKRISRGSLGKVSIKLPSIEKQTEIATILSDMDKEIELLEEKLSKYKQLKQGLMQNLLTGKIRLV